MRTAVSRCGSATGRRQYEIRWGDAIFVTVITIGRDTNRVHPNLVSVPERCSLLLVEATRRLYAAGRADR